MFPLSLPRASASSATQRDPSSERWNCGRERCPVVILPKFRLPRKFKDLLHAANLRHGTDGFTSPPKEGVLRIFFCPRTWVPTASTLPLDHRSRVRLYNVIIFFTLHVLIIHPSSTSFCLYHSCLRNIEKSLTTSLSLYRAFCSLFK